jgi:alpha-tubulin suppressor-like RCC1 family protein
VTKLATGLRSAGALLADGTLWTWGDNYYHQLGYGTANPVVTIPHQVPGLNGITQFALSDEGNGYAVGAGGTLWGWGDNSFGQLGTGSTSPSYTPVQVPGLTGVTQATAGPYYMLALKSDGTVWAWGRNGDGSLGDGSTWTGRGRSGCLAWRGSLR